MNNIIITGLYRSGTSFIEKALDSHKDVEILHQPFMRFFNYIDRKIWENFKKLQWPGLPLGYTSYWDYYHESLSSLYFHKDEIKSMLEQIVSDIEQHDAYNTSLLPKANYYELAAKAISDGGAHGVLNGFLDAVKEYRGHHAKAVGFKELFLTSLTPYFLKMNDTVVIQLIRDPREIYYSRNYVKSEKIFGTLDRHPVKMVAEIWRQSILIKNYCINRNLGLIPVYYDKIQENSQDTIDSLFTILGLEKVEIGELKDESSNKWQINTSDVSGNIGFGKKWKEDMKEEHVAVIEYICGDLMESEGYPRVFTENACKKIAFGYVEDISDLRQWTKKEELINIV